MARLEFIEKIPETIGIGGFVIILLVVLIAVVLFIIFRFLKKSKPEEIKPGEGKPMEKELEETKPAEVKEIKLEGRLEKLKKKLEELDRIRRSAGKSPSEL